MEIGQLQTFKEKLEEKKIQLKQAKKNLQKEEQRFYE